MVMEIQYFLLLRPKRRISRQQRLNSQKCAQYRNVIFCDWNTRFHLVSKISHMDRVREYIRKCNQDPAIFLTAQKIKFSSNDFFKKCDQICSFLRICSHLLKKSLMENFSFCTVSKMEFFCKITQRPLSFNYFRKTSLLIFDCVLSTLLIPIPCSCDMYCLVPIMYFTQRKLS